jgi:hypothetical protein
LKRLIFGMLRIQNPVGPAGVAGSPASLLASNLTGFGTFEPAPIEPRRYRMAAAALGSVRDNSLASVLAVAINPWGHFGLARLLRNNHA